MAKAKTPPADTAAPTTPDAKRPVRREGTSGEAPVIARKVFILAHTSGERAALADVALHEIPLLRRKIPLLGGNDLKVLGEWPENVDRVRNLTSEMVREEYTTLENRYTFDKPGGREGEQVNLLGDVYGPLTSGRLIAVMRRLEVAWRKMMAQVPEGEEPTEDAIEDVLKLAEPEHDFGALADIDADITAEA